MIGKTAHELQAMIMDHLRGNSVCAALTGVVVSPAGDDGEWRVSATVRHGESLPSDCDRARIAIAVQLRRDYFLLTDA